MEYSKDNLQRLIKKGIPEEDYRVINYILQYHPTFSKPENLDQLLAVYMMENVGMVILRSLIPTARSYKKLQDELSAALAKVDAIKERMHVVEENGFQEEHCKTLIKFNENNVIPLRTLYEPNMVNKVFEELKENK